MVEGEERGGGGGVLWRTLSRDRSTISSQMLSNSIHITYHEMTVRWISLTTSTVCKVWIQKLWL